MHRIGGKFMAKRWSRTATEYKEWVLIAVGGRLSWPFFFLRQGYNFDFSAVIHSGESEYEASPGDFLEALTILRMLAGEGLSLRGSMISVNTSFCMASLKEGSGSEEPWRILTLQFQNLKGWSCSPRRLKLYHECCLKADVEILNSVSTCWRAALSEAYSKNVDTKDITALGVG